MHTGFWWGNLRERDHLEDPSVVETIILNGSSRSGMGAWAELTWLRIRTCGGSCECGNEPSESIKYG